MKKILLSILFSIIFSWQSYGQLNSIRMAYYCHGANLKSGFVVHAGKTNYNYVLVEFCFKDVADPIGKMSSEIEKAFKIAAQNKMRLIPKIQINSCWSTPWRFVRDNDNPLIKMNLIWAKNRSQKKLQWWGCPSFAPDPKGTDKSFEDLIKAIVSAHDSANVSYPLDFIHLGSDEPAFYEFLFIGGVTPGKHGKNKPKSMYISDTPREFSQSDRDWVKNFLGTDKYTDENISLAFQALIVNSLYRKMQIIKKHSPNTKVMVYGDAWDPCMGGANSFRTSFKRKHRTDEYCVSQLVPDVSTGIATLPGLTDDEKKFFRENIVLLPWNYSGLRAKSGIHKVHEDYDTYKTFSYLSNNGFKFVYTFELLSKSDSWPPAKCKINQMHEFVKTAKLFKQNCLGYNATHWGAIWSNPKHKDCFRTMEELFKANQ